MRRIALLLTALAACAPASRLTPVTWSDAEQARFLGPMQAAIRTTAGSATGRRGAVTVAYNAYAARAGLDILQHGGNAMDAALTTAVTQVATTAGSPVSYFGIMSLVYYDAKTRTVSTLWAGWRTVRGETDGAHIPGAVVMAEGQEPLGTVPSGRTALVGGMLKGVEAAHRRFGKLPFAALFAPAIRVAESGMPVHATLAHQFELRAADLSRLPETRANLLKPDGSAWRVGDTLRQPALAATLRHVAAEGTDYMYNGPWGRKLVAAVQADGGKMTFDDLASYTVVWGEAVRARVHSYEIAAAGAPNSGGTALLEAQQVAVAAGLPGIGHWSSSPEAMRRAVLASSGIFLDFFPPAVREQITPGVAQFSEKRLTAENGVTLWRAIDEGKLPVPFAAAPKHSDDVVVVDDEGNMAAITHSINCVYWGKTAINIDGISIGDPGSFQQAEIARVGPGYPLPDPTETGIVFKDGAPVLAFASMGSGLHQHTMLSLLNVLAYGMTVDQAIDAPDFFFPSYSAKDSGFVVPVPENRFADHVLNGMGFRYRSVARGKERLEGEGVWVGISRDPTTGQLRAGSHNRNNSAALAW
jgi:gamma-glutamyltranspeptidase / glutathione hydrolase